MGVIPQPDMSLFAETRRAARSLGAVLALGLLGACNTGCDADLGIRLTPVEQTLVVGQSFTPSIALRGCGGTAPLSDVITWTAQDTTIVRIDSRSGQTTALRPGETDLLATGRTYGAVGEVAVTVVSP
jgi:hypothetical protein